VQLLVLLGSYQPGSDLINLDQAPNPSKNAFFEAFRDRN
jgi:hypothetical protein